MTEVRRQYRILNPVNFVDLSNQLNIILMHIADRLDQMEGYRGTPSFQSDVDMNANKITQAADGSAGDDVPTVDQILDLPGDVDGPSSSTDNAITRFNGITGKIIQNSTATLSDTGTLVTAAVISPALTGGTGSGDDITIKSTSHATKGDVIIQDATNGAQFESDGTLVFNGTCTVWEDLRSPVTAIKVPAAKAPTWTAYSGGQVLSFADQALLANEEEVYIIAQIPHSYKAGTSIYPHVHWVAPSDEATKVVYWGLEYEWVNISGTFSSATTIYCNAATNNNKDTHLMASFSAIVGTGKTISSILVMRLFRHSSNAADTYTDAAYLLEFDLHYESDTVGSRTESAK